MLKLRLETEDWREVVNGWADSQHLDDAQIDEVAGDLQAEVLRLLDDAGVEYERAYQQRVGAFAIVQDGSEEERATFDTALERAIAELAS